MATTATGRSSHPQSASTRTQAASSADEAAASGESLADSDLIDWTATLLAAIFPAPVEVVDRAG
jgi:hypothetical protein